MPALRSLTEILSQNLTDTLTPHGAIQLNLFNPGILPRVLNRLNPKIPEFQLSEFFGRLCVFVSAERAPLCRLYLDRQLILMHKLQP